MASASREVIETQIDRLFRNGTLTSLSDAQLLDRYLNARDEAAFEALVNLHGPMVLGLCRRMLPDPSDIDDAFQATFLVLVRKAPALRDRGLLANWLYGVAYRVAVRARGNLLRRRERETSLPEIETAAMSVHDPSEEIPPALDQELNRLPARYRAALVLCYLKGLPHEQAAQELHCPVGTVRSRLARGRDLLKRRLAARGYAPSASLLGAALSAPAVPASLVRATLEAATRFSAGQGVAAATVASAVETLAEGALTTMIGTRFKTIALSLLALALTTGAVVGVVFVSSHRARSVPPTPPHAAQTKTSEPEETALAPPKVKPGDWLRIEVLQALPDRPINGTRVVRPDGTISLGFYGDLQVAGLDRYQIKINVVNRLRKYLPDDVLGLLEIDPLTSGPVFETDASGKEIIKRIKPLESDRVFVDESVEPYSPRETDKRIAQLEEKLLGQLRSRLKGLPQSKTEARQDNERSKRSPAAVESGPENSLSQSPTQESRNNGRPEHLRPTASGWPMWLAGSLTSEKTRVEVLEKEVANGKVTPEDLAMARSAFQALKQMIPECVRRCREKVNSAKEEERELRRRRNQLESQLSAAQAHLEKMKRRLKEGKILEEEMLDAQGDCDAVQRAADLIRLYEDGRLGADPEPELKMAQHELELAEQLQAQYLGTQDKPAANESKAK